MKKIILSTIVSTIILAGLAFAPTSARADGGRALQGVWDSQVTLTDCEGHTIASFRALEMFGEGGTVTSVDNTPPTGHGPGLGQWEFLGDHMYSAPFQFFNFNSDGSFAEVQKIERTIKLMHQGSTYASSVTFQAIDPNGNVVRSGCGSEAATRIH
jgi:hypothetical protein